MSAEGKGGRRSALRRLTHTWLTVYSALIGWIHIQALQKIKKSKMSVSINNITYCEEKEIKFQNKMGEVSFLNSQSHSIKA